VALFTDLRQFELAKQWALELGAAANLSPTSVVANGAPRPDGASNAKVAELIAAQAAWSEEVRRKRGNWSRALCERVILRGPQRK
jgi:hypothetical protein